MKKTPPESGNTGKMESARNRRTSLTDYEKRNLDLLEKIILEISQMNDQTSEWEGIFIPIEETEEMITKWREYYPLLDTALQNLSHEELEELVYWLQYGENLYYYYLPLDIGKKFATDIDNNQFFLFLKQVQDKIKFIAKTLERKELMDLLSYDTSKSNLVYKGILQIITTTANNQGKLSEKIKNLKENLGEMVFDILKKQQKQGINTGVSLNGSEGNNDSQLNIKSTYKKIKRLTRKLSKEGEKNQKAMWKLKNIHKKFNSKKIIWPQDPSKQWKLHDLIIKQIAETGSYLTYSDEKLPPGVNVVASGATETHYLLDLKNKKIWNAGDSLKETYHLDPFHLLIFEKPYPGIEREIESSLKEMIEHYDLTIEGNPKEYMIYVVDFLDFIQPSKLKELVDASSLIEDIEDGDSTRYEDNPSNVEKETSIEDHTEGFDLIKDICFQGSITHITSEIAKALGKKTKEVMLLNEEGEILPLLGWKQIEEPQHYKELFYGKPAIGFKGKTLGGKTGILVSNGEDFEFFETS